MPRVWEVALLPTAKIIELGVFVAALTNIVDWRSIGAEGVLVTTYIFIKELTRVVGESGVDSPRKKHKRNRRKRKKKR